MCIHPVMEIELQHQLPRLTRNPYPENVFSKRHFVGHWKTGMELTPQGAPGTASPTARPRRDSESNPGEVGRGPREVFRCP